MPPSNINIRAFLGFSDLFWARIRPEKPFPSKFTLIKSFYGLVLIKNMWENAKNVRNSLLWGGGGICQDKETRDSGWFYTTNGEFTCQLDLPSTKSWRYSNFRGFLAESASPMWNWVKYSIWLPICAIWSTPYGSHGVLHMTNFTCIMELNQKVGIS